MSVARNFLTLPENGRAGISMLRIMMAERKQYTSIMRRLIWPLLVCITIARPLSPRKPTPPIMARTQKSIFVEPMEVVEAEEPVRGVLSLTMIAITAFLAESMYE